MIDFGGTIYQLDLDKLSEAIKLEDSNTNEEIIEKIVRVYKNEKGEITGTEEVTTSRERGIEYNTTKYDMLRTLIEIVLDDTESDVDTTLGVDSYLDKQPLSFKMAFNTLLEYEIIKEI
jgi:hypothetical protein